MKAWSAGSRLWMRSSNASTASTGDSVRSPNARDSSATVAQTGSIRLIRHPPFVAPPEATSRREQVARSLDLLGVERRRDEQDQPIDADTLEELLRTPVG